MTADIIILLVGLAAVVLGADFLVDGASSIAHKSGISPFVIGLTIVGFGTSCPEMVVSVTGALEGNSAVSVGNVIGSNVFNTLLILGISSLILPVTITDSNRKRDIPITLLATILFATVGFSNTILGIGNDGLSRLCGIVFLCLFSIYLYSCFRFDSHQGDEQIVEFSIFKSLVLILAGLVGLVVGGRFFVDSAVEIAKALGVSDKFIAITILATGTSLPELVTSVVACIKKQDQMALGNILGSNVFNILLILGIAATISPLSLEGIDVVDLIAFVASAALLLLYAFTGKKGKIDRWEGLVMLLIFALYYYYLFRTI